MIRWAVIVGMALTGAAATTTRAAAAEDLRSVERLSYRCRSPLGQRDVTLFGNGTVRLRERAGDDDRMMLAELPPEELADVLRLLARVDPTDNPTDGRSGVGGPTGDWIERCELALDLPDADPQRFTFGRYDARSLKVGRLIAVAERLARIAAEPPPASSLPNDYWPRYGDVLRDLSGHRWRVLFVTEDRRGVELQGLDQPLRRIVAVEALRAEFVAVDATRRP